MNMELNPKQSDFAAYYLNPDSPTYSNATQSALKAGYTQEYADNITSLLPLWLSELMGKKKRLLSKAEKVLELTLDQTEDLKLSQDTAKFIAKTVGKADYSERNEVTGANGESLTPLLVRFVDNDKPNS